MVTFAQLHPLYLGFVARPTLSIVHLVYRQQAPLSGHPALCTLSAIRIRLADRRYLRSMAAPHPVCGGALPAGLACLAPTFWMRGRGGESPGLTPPSTRSSAGRAPPIILGGGMDNGQEVDGADRKEERVPADEDTLMHPPESLIPGEELVDPDSSAGMSSDEGQQQQPSSGLMGLIPGGATAPGRGEGGAGGASDSHRDAGRALWLHLLDCR